MSNPNSDRDDLRISDGVKITAFIIGVFVFAVVLIPVSCVLAILVTRAIAEWMGI